MTVRRASGTSRSGSVAVRWFLDAPEVIRLMGIADAESLAKSGRYVHVVARNSIKRSNKKPSPPGKPPRTRNGFLKKDILYGFDPQTKTVVIGPTTVPFLNTLHEAGGSQVLKRWRNATGSVKFTREAPPRANGPWRQDGTVTAKYPARPFMSAALEKSLPRISRFWRNSFRRR